MAEVDENSYDVRYVPVRLRRPYAAEPPYERGWEPTGHIHYRLWAYDSSGGERNEALYKAVEVNVYAPNKEQAFYRAMDVCRAQWYRLAWVGEFCSGEH